MSKRVHGIGFILQRKNIKQLKQLSDSTAQLYKKTNSADFQVPYEVASVLAQYIQKRYDAYKSSIVAKPVTGDYASVVRRHTISNNSSQDFRFAKGLRNSITDYSVEVYAFADETADGKTSVKVRGPDVRFLEYGTGQLAEDSHETQHLQMPAGYRILGGSHEKTDEETGIMYWTYQGIAHVGNAPGKFIYNGMKDFQEYTKTVSGKKFIIDSMFTSEKKQIIGFGISEKK